MMSEELGAQLATTWAALAGGEAKPAGWTRMAIGSHAGVRIGAGVRFPERSEALLLAPGSISLTGAALPAGAGFETLVLDGGAGPELALVRRGGGQLDLFTAMAADVAMAAIRGSTGHRLLERVRAWQSFMSRTADPRLSLEAQIGLAGELVVIERLMDSGVSPEVLVAAWKGPIGGVTDFETPLGALEVKSTARSGIFIAGIDSLEQLDEARVPRLHLGAVRLVRGGPHGRTVPEIAEDLAGRMSPACAQRLAMLLVSAGCAETMHRHMTERFAVQAIEFFGVRPEFPRLARSAIPGAITSARYALDVSHLGEFGVDVGEIVSLFGEPGDGE